MRHARLRTAGTPATRPLWALLIAATLLLTGSNTALAGHAPDEAPEQALAGEGTEHPDSAGPSGTAEPSDSAAQQGSPELPGAPGTEEADAETQQALEHPEPSRSGADGEGSGQSGPGAEHPGSEDRSGTGEPTPTDDDRPEDAARSENADESEAADDGVAPTSVPSPSGTTAVVTATVGGSRAGDHAIGTLAGATLRLYDGGSHGPSTPVHEEWAECISDADGDCSFTIPDTQQRVVQRGDCIRWFLFFCAEYEQIEVTPLGENRDSRFWVVLESAPAGWSANQTLITGSATSQQATDYQFRTGSQLRAGNVYSSGSQFMTDPDTSTRTASSGIWQLSASNPALPPTCQAGLDVALVLDLSGSVGDAGATGDLKSAAIGFAEALEGTGSALALYTFASTAPRSSGAAGANYDLMPVDGNLDLITSRINGYSTGGGTNWDRGINQVAQNSTDYDLAVVVTDGLPTFYGTGAGGWANPDPPGPGNSTRFREVEEAVFSANALKAQGTRVLAVGVGTGISADPANLAAISGPRGYTPGASVNDADYVQAGWQQLADLLENVAQGATCQASITVTKTAEPYGGQAGPGAGWDFDVTRSGGEGDLSPTGVRTTGHSGALDYTLQFDSMTATADLTVAELISAEQRAAGWALDGVACTINNESQPLEPGDGAITLTGVGVGDDVVCTFSNVQSLVPSIDLQKRAWDVPQGPVDPDDPGGAIEIDTGSTVPAGSHLTWTYTVTNTGQTVLENIVVTDDQDVQVTCPATELTAGASMTCWGSGTVTALTP